MQITSNNLQQSVAQKDNFEELLLSISALFINLSVDKIDSVIEDTQRRICNCLNLDFSVLWQWSTKDSSIMTVTHVYSPPSGPKRPADIDASKTFPWITSKILSGETLAFSNKDLPEEAILDKETRLFFGAESSVVIPLMAGGEPILGALSFDRFHEERTWSREEVRRLKLVAELFTNALLRKRSENRLIESEARLALAAESAEAGLWELDFETGVFWATQKARKLFGYGSDEAISMSRFEQSVHPEDLAGVRQALAKAFNKREQLIVEYRIQSDTEFPTWIYSRGRPYFHTNGNPARMLGISIDVSESKQLNQQLKRNLDEIERLKLQLEQENYFLRADLTTEQGYDHIIGQSKPFKAALASASKVAPTSATVLLLGETGTGKGVIANAIHKMSDRSNQPFVTVNCAALPDNLVESELFGRKKGSYTGAHASQAGRFEVANKGTIFLDEIGEMPLELQTKLLRVLQDGEFEMLGSTKTIKVDVRVIAATSRNLKEDMRIGRFREDLYYRLNVFPITIPPLRQRRDDIPLLAQHFIETYSRKIRKEINSISKRSWEKMLNYSWPGNVRELEHLIERSIILSPGNSLVIGEQLLPEQPDSSNHPIKSLNSLERDHIRGVLSMTNWKIEGPGGAALILDIHPSTLRYRIKKLKIERPS